MHINLLWIVALVCAIATPAAAQHNHAAGHAFYQGWVNQKDGGCCDDHDCGALRDEDEREAGGKLEVRIEGQWCPVLPHHYLKKGNAPNWQTAHVCVRPLYPNEDGTPDETPPCERLLCFQPKPKF